MEKIIGILGGMGPLATVDLFRRIVMKTPAKKDQDHPRIIIYNNSKVPDRTAYILGRGEDPLPELIDSAKKLEQWGAGFIIMPCNTAHHKEQITQAVEIFQRDFPNPIFQNKLCSFSFCPSGYCPTNIELCTCYC